MPPTTTDASGHRLAPSPLRGGGPAGTSEFDGATVIVVLATEVYGRIALVRLAFGVSLSAVVAPIATVAALVCR
jgi:ABC-type dipeptide/oligopeptide/nickel transport system permease subunit